MSRIMRVTVSLILGSLGVMVLGPPPHIYIPIDPLPFLGVNDRHKGTPVIAGRMWNEVLSILIGSLVIMSYL